MDDFEADDLETEVRGDALDLSLDHYLVWLQLTDELVVTSHEVNDFDEVTSMSFSHGETLYREGYE